ncbi:peroxisomal membrane anchor protein conserved region-domain-containing protein [Coniochaeta sp. 2T2.1]|nr:peroxisomal membrane anchor protein conserved region-domain-containing protein [Coniochaeta sp. 2T2.1]
MSDADSGKKAAVPEWQRTRPQAAPEPTSSPRAEEGAVTVQQAKRFLQDDEVRKYSREKKAEFLKGKGFDEDVVQRLLQEEDSAEGISQVAEPQTLPTPSHSEPKDDRPPIVTYPEFLTKPTRPPPLMTVSRFLNTLYAFAGVSTLVYGTSKFVVAPMVDNLTEARISLHDTAKDNLSRLVEKLESTVSEIPTSTSAAHHKTTDSHDGSTSEYDDPTELFHRDIGVQTSPPPTPNPYGSYTSPPESSSLSPEENQSRRLGQLASSLREVERGFKSESEDYDDIKALVGVFQDELDEMSRTASGLVSSSSLYGFGRGVEPDDEIRRAKEGVRRVKGVLLSARSFPAGR